MPREFSPLFARVSLDYECVQRVIVAVGDNFTDAVLKIYEDCRREYETPAFAQLLGDAAKNATAQLVTRESLAAALAPIAKMGGEILSPLLVSMYLLAFIAIILIFRILVPELFAPTAPPALKHPATVKPETPTVVEFAAAPATATLEEVTAELKIVLRINPATRTANVLACNTPGSSNFFWFFWIEVVPGTAKRVLVFHRNGGNFMAVEYDSIRVWPGALQCHDDRFEDPTLDCRWAFACGFMKAPYMTITDKHGAGVVIVSRAEVLTNTSLMSSIQKMTNHAPPPAPQNFALRPVDKPASAVVAGLQDLLTIHPKERTAVLRIANDEARSDWWVLHWKDNRDPQTSCTVARSISIDTLYTVMVIGLKTVDAKKLIRFDEDAMQTCAVHVVFANATEVLLVPRNRSVTKEQLQAAVDAYFV